VSASEDSSKIIRQIAFASGLFQGDITIRTLLESLAEGVVIIDDSGTILLVNAFAERMFGYEGKELIGSPHAVLIPERFHDVHREHQAKFFTEPKIRPMGQLLDLVGRRKDGSEFPLEICLSFIETINGILVMAFISDITERKQFELRLLESEQRFAAFMLHLPAAAWIKDLNGRYVYANPEAERVFDMPLSELKGRTDMEIFQPDTARQFHENDDRVLAEDGHLQTIEILPQADHLEHYSIVSKFSVPGADGKTVFVGGVAFDITDLQHAKEEISRLNAELAGRAVELEITNRELEAFNATVAHDLRQPLNLLGMCCQAIKTLCGDQLQENCKEYVQQAHDTILRMNSFIDALLNFSRIGHADLRLETVDLGSLAREIASMLQQTNTDRQVEFRIADGVVVTADANLLRVVLGNLIGNAWKYTTLRDKVVIEIGSSQIDEQLVYFVRDNGTGFDMKEADKLFIPFQRLSSAASSVGFGVGLATVWRIIHRHGGRVWAESKLGEGATFYFTLPVER
jgi:PAS domain S-box-containing protein